MAECRDAGKFAENGESTATGKSNSDSPSSSAQFCLDYVEEADARHGRELHVRSHEESEANYEESEDGCISHSS